MIEQIVRPLSDGEEMVVERESLTAPEDPADKRIEARRVALDRDASPLEGNQASRTLARTDQRREDDRAT